MGIDHTLYYGIYLVSDELDDIPDELTDTFCWNNKDTYILNKSSAPYVIFNVDPYYDMVYQQEHVDYDRLIGQFKEEYSTVLEQLPEVEVRFGIVCFAW